MENKETNKNEQEKKQTETSKTAQSTWKLLPSDVSKKLHLILAIIMLSAGGIFLVMAFLPAAKIKSVSLGNYFINAFDFLKYLSQDIKILKFEYDHTLLWGSIMYMHSVTLICMVIGAYMLWNGFVSLRKYFKTEKDFVIDSKIGIVRLVIQGVIEVVFIVLAFLHLKTYEELFLLDFPWQRIMLVIATIAFAASAGVKIYFSRMGETISDSKAYKMVHTKNTHEEAKIKLPFVTMLFVTLFSFGLLSGILGENHYRFINTSELTEMRYAFAPELCNLMNIAVGEEAPTEDCSIRVQDVEIASFNFSKKDSFSIKWDENYYFYQEIINSKKEELKKLMPKDMENIDNLEDAEEILGKYLKKAEKLTEEIEILEEQMNKLPVPVESYRRDPASNIITEYIYNTNRIDKEKNPYGSSESTILSWGKESIVVKNAVFEEGTDFSKEKIIVTVTYKDGSMKSSMIIPENYEKLNQASKGTHTIKWSDSWGEYSAKIKIQ